jgi:hypothetical protein
MLASMRDRNYLPGLRRQRRRHQQQSENAH